MNSNDRLAEVITPCGEDCRAPACICDHPDDCPCTDCAEDRAAEYDLVDEWDHCGDPDCDGHTDAEPELCPVDCACPWCTDDQDDDTPNITTIHANPAYL